MADKKISQLTAAATPLVGTEAVPVVQSGSTVKVAVDDLTAGRAVSALSLTLSGGTANGVPYLNATKQVTTGTDLTFDGTNLGLKNGAQITFNGALGFYGDANQVVIRARATTGITFQNASGGTIGRITNAGNTIAGNFQVLATNATDGFLYVPTCAGTPVGTPTAQANMAPIVVDATNNKLYFYSGGAWRDAGP